jgi:lipoprotein-anchoring transpeptidase ErfK/SrfK
MIVPNPTDAAAERAQAGPATLLSRRQLLVAAGGLALAGCTATKGTPPAATAPVAAIPERYRLMYGPLPNERFPIPAVDLTRIDPAYFRQLVAYSGPEPVGTIVVDTGNRFLYLVRENGTALRYGIGIGREGFAWDGAATIELKREWPIWTPPAEMIARQPELEDYRFGMDPGLDNPLGARALYLFQNGRDTLYRLHGTIEDWSIGRAVSSGCVRLLNQDVIDLYDRVPVGTRVVVLPSVAAPALG